jgi:hypothetical protein
LKLVALKYAGYRRFPNSVVQIRVWCISGSITLIESGKVGQHSHRDDDFLHRGRRKFPTRYMAKSLLQIPRDGARLATGMRRFQTRQIWKSKSHGIRCSLDPAGETTYYYISDACETSEVDCDQLEAQAGITLIGGTRSRPPSANPRTRNLQEQNPSADVAQANTIHPVTLLIDWSFRHAFSCVKISPARSKRDNRALFLQRRLRLVPFSTVSLKFIIEGSGSPCRAAVSDLQDSQCCDNDCLPHLIRGRSTCMSSVPLKVALSSYTRLDSSETNTMVICIRLRAPISP